MRELVSVAVVTYNSSKYILECLNSINRQTYKTIELIVSDDCSTDNTVEIVNLWLEEHGNRFERVELLTTLKNCGIVPNKIKAEQACKGNYIKPIDGDDWLEDTFVEKCVNLMSQSSDNVFVFSNSFYAIETENKTYKEDITKFKQGFQFKEIFLVDYWISTASWFLRKSLTDEIGYDTTIWLDDYLRLLRISEKYPLCWLNEFLAYHRIHPSNTGGGSIKLFKAHMHSIERFREYPWYKQRKESILKYLSDCAEVHQPSYLIQMAFEYHRFSYLRRYCSIIRRNIRASIKKTKLFIFLRHTWLWRKFKGEI